MLLYFIATSRGGNMVFQKSISIFVLFFIFIGQLWAKNPGFDELKTTEYSLLNAYIELMESKKLIHQTDKRLKKRRLLKNNGGLCAFTAFVNAIQATSQYYQIYKSKFLKRPDYFLFEIINEARTYMETDPAYDGIDFISLVKYSNEILNYYGLNQVLRIKHVDLTNVNIDDFHQQYWKIRLLGMLSQDGKEGHTVVLLKVDKVNKLLYVSDPNYPNKIISAPYKQVRKKLYIHLSDDFPGFQPAWIDEMIEINIKRD